MAGLVVVRPEPGNAATVARARALGFDAIAEPLFAVAPVAWTLPDPDRFDALLVTSANAIRHTGPGLAALASLPVVAVGAATADAARRAGLRVAVTGTRDAAAAVAAARDAGLTRLLHLAGRDHHDAGMPVLIVYASEARPIPSGATQAWVDRTVLLHSARAGGAVAALVARDGTDRSRIALAAISTGALVAAGPGWRACIVADTPTDASLLAGLRERLTDRDAPGISTP